MCDYCEKEKRLMEFDIPIGEDFEEMAVEINENYLRLLGAGVNSYQDPNIRKINYCPMCGVKIIGAESEAEKSFDLEFYNKKIEVSNKLIEASIQLKELERELREVCFSGGIELPNKITSGVLKRITRRQK